MSIKKYNIGIIGAGNIGSALAKHLVSLGHSVVIANSRGPGTLTLVEKETGATAVSLYEAIRDVVIITIPINNISQLPIDLFDNAPKDVVILDTNNYYPGLSSSPIEVLDKLELTHSEWVAKTIGRTVIKVFNNITTFSLKFKATQDRTKRVALPIAGDDEKAKAMVIDLVDKIGFDPIDSGSLKDSWRQQPGTPAYCCDWRREELVEKLAQADRLISQKKVEESFSIYGKAIQEFNEKIGKNLSFIEILIEGGHDFNEKVTIINRSLY